MNPIATRPALGAMTPAAISLARRAERIARSKPQLALSTGHVFHAGMYARTITIPANAMITGALIKRATLLIVNGDCSVFTGDEQPMRLTGYHVLPASAGRKQVFITYADTRLTMIFPTQAKSVEAAEAEFTDETELLLSRESKSDLVVITGE